MSYACIAPEHFDTYILSEEIGLIIIVHEQAHVATLEPKWLCRALVRVLAANTASNRNSSFCLSVIGAIDVHPRHILLRALVVDDLWSLNDAIGSKVSGSLTGQDGAFILPFNQVCGGVAVDVLEGGAVRLVFSDPTL